MMGRDMTAWAERFEPLANELGLTRLDIQSQNLDGGGPGTFVCFWCNSDLGGIIGFTASEIPWHTFVYSTDRLQTHRTGQLDKTIPEDDHEHVRRVVAAYKFEWHAKREANVDRI
jgi:hypothetical protein